MPKITSSRLIYKQSLYVTDCNCLRIERTDGVVIRLTDADINLTMTTGVDAEGAGYTLTAPVTYVSVPLAQTAFSLASGGEIASVDMDMILDHPVIGITRADMLKGLYNAAKMYFFQTSAMNPVQDDEQIISAYWSESEFQDFLVKSRVESISSVLNKTSSLLYSASCRVELGSVRCQVRLTPMTWLANTVYPTPSTTYLEDADGLYSVRPTLQTGYYYRVVTGGTSGAVQPTWPVTIGGTVVDGGVTWQAIYAYVIGSAISSVGGAAVFTDNNLAMPVDWWAAGNVRFLTGANSGFKVKVRASTPAGVITLDRAPPFAMLAGDTYVITVGCMRRLAEDCRDKFRNTLNFQGEPFVPGEKAKTYGVQG